MTATQFKKSGYRETPVDILDAEVIETKPLNPKKWSDQDIAVAGFFGVAVGYFFGKKAKSRKRK